MNNTNTEKSIGEQKQQELFYTKKNYFEEADDSLKQKMFDYAEGYKKFLDEGKTERESCKSTLKIVKQHGFTEYKFGDKLKPGDKKFYVNRKKSLVFL